MSTTEYNYIGTAEVYGNVSNKLVDLYSEQQKEPDITSINLFEPLLWNSFTFRDELANKIKNLLEEGNIIQEEDNLTEIELTYFHVWLDKSSNIIFQTREGVFTIALPEEGTKCIIQEMNNVFNNIIPATNGKLH